MEDEEGLEEESEEDEEGERWLRHPERHPVTAGRAEQSRERKAARYVTPSSLPP